MASVDRAARVDGSTTRSPPVLVSTPLVPLLAVSVLLSALLTYLIVRFPKWHLALTGDATGGVQKFHVGSIPRIGGLPIAGAFLAAIGYLALLRDHPAGPALTGALITSAPVFLIGLIEDLTKRVEPLTRLVAMSASAFTAAALYGVRLTHLDLPFADAALGVPALSIAFTAFAVVGVANAFNIIDGYNGLVGMISAMVLTALATVALAVGDTDIMLASLALAGAIFGFLVWNYPGGRIFAGDGGAYFIGFVIAILAVLLAERHADVSPWFPLALVIYPVWETLFTIYRRKVLRGHAAMRPDALHLHTLIYRRLCRLEGHAGDPGARIRRNSLTSPYLWLLTLPFMMLATAFWHSTLALQCVIGGFILVYLGLYWSIVRFRAPQWLVLSYWAARRRARAARAG